MRHVYKIFTVILIVTIQESYGQRSILCDSSLIKPVPHNFDDVIINDSLVIMNHKDAEVLVDSRNKLFKLHEFTDTLQLLSCKYLKLLELRTNQILIKDSIILNKNFILLSKDTVINNYIDIIDNNIQTIEQLKKQKRKSKRKVTIKTVLIGTGAFLLGIVAALT